MSKPAPKPKLAAKPKSIKVFTATWGYQAQVIFFNNLEKIQKYID